MRVIELNFNDVEVGKTLVKTIQVMNDSSKNQTYEVQRDPGTNPLDHVFDIRNYMWTLKPKEVYSIEICYRPFIPFSKNIDYFVVLDSNDAVLQMVVRGSSIGPQVAPSMSTVVFCSDIKKSVVKKRIKLTNQSKATATFLLDVDPQYPIFKVEPVHGTIGPRSSEAITITFTPAEIRRYTLVVPALILHQEPIMITLFGYCGAVIFKNESFAQCECPWEMKDGFDGYMSDNLYTIGPLPPVSLSKNYFVFPHIDSAGTRSEDTPVQKIPQVISMTNLTDDNLTIEWEKDADGVFAVTPTKAIIQASDSILFEIRFYPNSKHPFFFREMIAMVFGESNQDQYLIFPYVTTIRAIGNSVPASSISWIPEYEIPHAVVMPPCVPLRLVHTTFLIRKSGKLPVMFRFVPPEVSRFTVKPMIGVIHSEFQIIAVEMAPKPEDGEIYVERWAIQLNGSENDEIYVYFKGYAEYANVCFSNSNTVNFPPTFPGSEHTQRVAMRNVTRHVIKYEFTSLPPELRVESLSGEILSNDIIWHEWTLCPTSNSEYDFEVYCDMSTLENSRTCQSTRNVTLRVSGKGEESYLMVVPNELNFLEQEYNFPRTLTFHIFNLSAVMIHFKIICEHRNWPVGDIGNDVEITPDLGSVIPGDHEEINLTITPHTVGYYELSVKYLVRKNSKTDAIVEKQIARSLCEVNCACVLPTLQVKNLCCYGSSPFVSKYSLWRLMKISRLNELFKNIQPGSTEVVNLIGSPLIINEDFIWIKLILTNQTNIPISWSMRRIYDCGCRPVMKQQGISFTRKVFKCIHENLCDIIPKSGDLGAQTEDILTVKLRSTLEGKSKISWDLAISHDRHIIMNFLMECVPRSEELFHIPHGRTIDFGRVNIGHKDFVYQAHWIRNFSSFCLPYSINIDPLEEINRTRNCEIFSCDTPTGVIKPGNTRVIILKFRARVFESYSFNLPLKVGTKEIVLKVTAEGTCGCLLPISYDYIPTDCIRIAESPVHFNTHCIHIKCMSTFDYATRMILVHNNSKLDTLSYEWKRRTVTDIVDVQVQPKKGLIRGSSTRSFSVRIYSKGQPAKIDLGVTCEFLNVSDRREHQRSVLKHNLLAEELKDQFTITEKGVDVPKPWIKILDEPKPFYKTLSVRCVIHSPENESSAMTLVDQLKIVPGNIIPINNKSRKKVICMSKKEVAVCTFILEGILWDIINSKWLQHTMRETLSKSMNLHYSQFSMNLCERKKLIERSYISSPQALICTIIEKMLYVVLHEEFCLETKHLIHDENIRHVNYLKEISKKPPPSLQMPYKRKISDPLVDENSERDHSKSQARRVSFSD